MKKTKWKLMGLFITLLMLALPGSAMGGIYADPYYLEVENIEVTENHVTIFYKVPEEDKKLYENDPFCQEMDNFSETFTVNNGKILGCIYNKHLYLERLYITPNSTIMHSTNSDKATFVEFSITANIYNEITKARREFTVEIPEERTFGHNIPLEANEQITSFSGWIEYFIPIPGSLPPKPSDVFQTNSEVVFRNQSLSFVIRETLTEKNIPDLEYRKKDNQTIIILDASSTPAPTPTPTPDPAPTPAQPQVTGLMTDPIMIPVLLVDSDTLSLQGYNIGGNNYFKLRDIAMLLNGTAKSFGVGWDAERQVIELQPGSPYAPAGGELQATQSGSVWAEPNETSISVNGEMVNITAYNINGNNFFKLRDIAALVNFGVGWNSDTQTIELNTAQDYAA